jgi:hypothetical protein
MLASIIVEVPVKNEKINKYLVQIEYSPLKRVHCSKDTIVAMLQEIMESHLKNIDFFREKHKPDKFLDKFIEKETENPTYIFSLINIEYINIEKI